MGAGWSSVDYPQRRCQIIAFFTRFADWPSKKFQGDDAPFVIGVLGDSVMTARMREVIGKQQFKDRQVAVREIAALEEMTGCHIVYIPRSESTRYAKAASQIRGESVLIVGEGLDFLEKGGHIAFVEAEQDVRFLIDTRNVRRSAVKLDPNLMQLAWTQTASR
jgi:hypothetical protein